MGTFIFDLDGTLYRDDEVLPGARETVVELRRRGHRVLYASNNSTRTRATYLQKLSAMGLEVEQGGLATTAYATGVFLRGLPDPPRSILVLGAPAIGEEILAAGVRARLDGVPPIDAVVLGLDQHFNYDGLAAAQAAVLAGARLIATNRDPQYPGRDRILPGAGSVVAAVETASLTRAITIGKPEPILYQTLIDESGADPASTVVVGDSMLTDIAAAKPLNLYSVLLLTGVSKRPDSEVPGGPDLVLPSVADLVPALEERRPDLVPPAS